MKNIWNILGEKKVLDEVSALQFNLKRIQSHHSTSHSAYVATETELYGAKIDGLLPPNFL